MNLTLSYKGHELKRGTKLIVTHKLDEISNPFVGQIKFIDIQTRYNKVDENFVTSYRFEIFIVNNKNEECFIVYENGIFSDAVNVIEIDDAKM